MDSQRIYKYTRNLSLGIITCNLLTQISPKPPPVILLQPFQQIFHRYQTPVQNSGNFQMPAFKITDKNNPYTAADTESTWPVWGFPGQPQILPSASVPLYLSNTPASRIRALSNHLYTSEPDE